MPTCYGRNSKQRIISKLDYKNKVLKHMRLNESLLKHDYAKIVDMKTVAEQSYDLMEAYIVAQELADKYSLPYIETSAFTAQNVKESIEMLLERVMLRMEKTIGMINDWHVLFSYMR